MSNYRYSFSFLISTIIFTLIGFSFLLFPQRVEPKKQIQKEVIKIAIITPIIKKKSTIKKVEPVAIKQPIIVPPIPLPTKVQKKRRAKKITKRKKVKKIVKKRKVIKKIKHKKSRKKIVKHKTIKHKITKKRVVKKIVKKRMPPKQEPAQIYQPIPEKITPPQAVLKNTIVPQRTVSPPPRVSSKIDKSKERKAFLNQIRSKIIANKKYPKLALRRHIQGSVTVKFDINRMGNVNNIRFLNGKTILQKSVKNAIKSSFPIDIPHSLKSELPINNISVKIHFNIH